MSVIYELHNVLLFHRKQAKLSRKELAELAGMSTESVIRILKKFQEDKFIRMTGKTFEILDQDGLQRICDLG